MNYNEVLRRFCKLSGLLTNEAESYSDIIDICISKVESGLRLMVDIEENEAILSQLAAVMSFYHYTLRNAVSSTHLIATDISMITNPKNQIECAKKLLDETYLLARDLMIDSDFLFCVIDTEQELL